MTKFSRSRRSACATLRPIESLERRCLLSAGDLDLSFGTGGKTMTDITSSGARVSDAVVLADGKLLVAGTFDNISIHQVFVARYGTDGRLDSSFGTGGVLRLNASAGSASGDLLVMSDGSFIIGGVGSWVRFKSDGTILASASSQHISPSIDARSDGKVFTHSRDTVYRFNANGSEDTSFHSINLLAGAQLSSLQIHDVTRTADGKILVTGEASGEGIFEVDTVVFRLLDNGDLDKSFSGDGAQFIDSATFELGLKSIVQSDGKIVTLVQSEDAVDAVQRLNSDGSPDATFGTDPGRPGLVIFTLGGVVGGRGNQVRDIALDKLGNVIVSGTTELEYYGGNFDFAATRITPRGQIDTTFGIDGLSVVDFSTLNQVRSDANAALALAPDGRILLAGTSEVGSETPTGKGLVAVARLQSAAAAGEPFAELVGDGVLRVLGTASANTIEIASNNSQIVATRDGQSFSFPASSVMHLLVDGADGNDVVTVSAMLSSGEQSTVNGGGGNDKLTGTSSSPIFYNGGDGNDSIYGGPGNDHLSGDSGDDWLDGGLGNDSIAGRDGFDTVSYATRTQSVAVYLGSTTKPSGQSGENDYLYFGPIEAVVGGSGNDSIVGDSRNNSLSGAAGYDTIYAGGGDDTVDGGTANDFLDGGAGQDVVSYASRGYRVNASLVTGHSTVPAANEADTLFNFEGITGGRGDDTLTGNDTNGIFRGGPGNDQIFAAGGADALFGDDGNDLLDGGTGNDYLQGWNGNDTLHGRDGSDVLDGGTGSDQFFGDAGSDTADFSNRGYSLNISLNDLADDGPRFVSGEIDNVHSDVETVLGGSGNDSITGSSAANLLKGNAGNDTLRGGGGNDTVDGGSGADQLVGDAGDDRLLAKDSVRDSVDGGSGIDTAQRDNSSRAD